jgi:Rieske Fe-S protein
MTKLIDKLLTRKNLLKLMMIIMLSSVLKMFMDLLTSANIREEGKNRHVKIPLDLPDGVHFFSLVIINKKGDSLTVLSSTCPHLGCRIRSFENDRLVCPCHGSQYSADGKLIKGPSQSDLAKLAYYFDEKEEKIVVDTKKSVI